MKKIILNLGILIMSSLLAISGNIDVSKFAVGRVRFVEGDSAKFEFRDKSLNVDFDYIVLLGATFETKKGRLEVVDLNNDTFWFDKDTFFNFEAYDTVGQRTTMFLGKGSFACKTKKPFSVITSSGSILFPANGTYVVEKQDFGKTETIITVIEGIKPTIIKKTGIFSKFNFEDKDTSSSIYKWMVKKEQDWQKTIVRTKIFSNCARMSPYIADTKLNGKVNWVKVGFVKPLYTADLMIDGNAFYYYNEDILRASGIAPDLVDRFNDNELRLWFVTNKYNAIKWAWDVSKGWHTELYYDPLSFFGAQYRSSYSSLFDCMLYRRGPLSLSKTFLNPDYYTFLPVRYHKYDSLKNVTPKKSIVRSQVKPVKGTVKVVKPFAVKTRMNTDRTLVKSENAGKLGFTLRQMERAEIKQQHAPGRTGGSSHLTSVGYTGRAQVRPRGNSYYTSRVVGKVSGNTRK